MSSAAPELPSINDWLANEPDAIARWATSNVFHAESRVPADRPRYSIVIPPPNVTAALHLGHALNNTLQDVLVRYHRMRGDATLWMPGTDHAGIATQTVVEKRLLAEGIRRLEMGREAFVAKTQEWKDEYESVIIDQLLQMGASCDFERTRFTMDEMCATAVRHAFFVLFRDGLVYRNKRLVNWDPATRTALADDEVEMHEVAGHMWYLRYPLTDGSGHVTVATTRPETMLGDTAVAVNPADPRAAELVGKTVTLPIVDRIVPIIADDYVVMADPGSNDVKAQYASGFLKVTPAHDPNDWDIGQRHGLPIVNVLGPDGAISDRHGWDDVSDSARQFVGLSREAARDAVVGWFEAHGLLEQARPYSHSVGHSYRSHVPIEPWLSDQWWVAVTDDRLRGAALRAQDARQVPELPVGIAWRTEVDGDGGLRFYPERYARTYYAWHAGIRDWCISRQLWWGHQIPVWSRSVRADSAPDEAGRIAVGDRAVAVTSRWTDLGAAHVARRIDDDAFEESVCVPPDSTLCRSTRLDTTLDEAGLVAALEADGFVRDPDVLDTWFSSALWPLSTMGWPWPDEFPETMGLLDIYNPTSVLCTAREIITLWVSRMVMFNRYFLGGRVPFRDVFIHAMIQDGHGQKMSKSLGNGVDPRDIIHSHGADAMRFALVQMTTDTQDVRMPVDLICPHSGQQFTPDFITTPAGHVVAAPIQKSPADPSRTMVSAYGVATGIEPTAEAPLARNSSPKFDIGRNFANKVWNATRFALKRVPAGPPINGPIDIARRPFPDRWIVARLAEAVADLERSLDRYQFNAFADTLYDFVWHDVCDRYLEMVKPTVDDDREQQAVLAAVLDAVLRILHPVCPFVTETLWPHVRAARCGAIAGVELPDSELAAGARWPSIDATAVDGGSVSTFRRIDELVGEVRTIRANQNVKPRHGVTLHSPGPVRDLIASVDGVVETLAGIAAVAALDGERPPLAVPFAFEGAEVLVSNLSDRVDLDAERARLRKLVDTKTAQVAGFEAKLSNPKFVDGAPEQVVVETRARLEAAKADLAAARESLTRLG